VGAAADDQLAGVHAGLRVGQRAGALALRVGVAGVRRDHEAVVRREAQRGLVIGTVGGRGEGAAVAGERGLGADRLS